MRKYILLAFLSTFGFVLSAQILSGPMLGHNTMREVSIWLQTEEPAVVYLEYWKEGTEDKFVTGRVNTIPFRGNTAHLFATYLEPGTRYEYEIFVNGEKHRTENEYSFTTQTLWQYRMDPPPFKFAMGSCLFTNDKPYDRPGEPYGDTSEVIFGSIIQQDPDFMLWLGDNIYLRTPDFNSHSGIYYRYADYKSRDSLQKMWSSMHHYAIWDDHDFGPNNSDRSYIYKDLSRQAFIDFWANPTYGRNSEGVYTEFYWADCQFILLDNRYFRTPNDLKEEGRTVLGDKQLQWLKDRLIGSHASFKFVAMGGQFLNPAAMYENYATYEQERDEIIDFIYENDIQNVIFLTGDRHRAELSRLDEENEPVIYDLTVSPLSSGVYRERGLEKNTLRLDETYFVDHNFATAEITGPFRNRTLTLRLFNKFGEEVWKFEIPQK